MSTNKYKKLIHIIFISFIGISTIFIYSYLSLPKKLFKDDHSTVILDKNGEILRVFLNSEESWKFPENGKSVPVKLEKAIIFFEDKRFYEHHGVDIISLGRAFFKNIIKRKRISGASTITMQLARLSKPKKRTYFNKVIEICQAIIIDIKYSKKEILKMYINNAPYGGNIIGYEAASLRYFGKEPVKLTWSEAAILAVLPNAPGLINPNSNRDKLLAKKNKLLEKLNSSNEIDNETLKLSKLEPLPKGQRSFPFFAPHFTRKLFNKHKNQFVKTTIDKKTQIDVQNIVKEYMQNLQLKGIKNCSVLIVDTNSGEMISYIGSQDYFDNNNLGKVDGVKSKRSTGSTLKPFLYGLSIDDGIISNESILEDIPFKFGSYTPYNSNKKFKGLVTVKESLVNSLNTTSVFLLSKYGINRFYDFLVKTGVGNLKKNYNNYGLPLILGSAELSLYDLVKLYRGLGNNGNFTEINYLPKKNSNKNELISSGASYQILEILKDVKRPGVEKYMSKINNVHQFAWKTGTSYGNRDGLAIGLNKNYTIGVWTGNFTGEGIKEISGIRSAAPLLFRIQDYLSQAKENIWFEKDKKDFIKIDVSRKSGFRVKKELLNFIETKKIDYPKNAKPLNYSKFEKIIYTNKNENMELCSLCWKDKKYKKTTVFEYNPLLKKTLESKGVFVSNIKHNNLCKSNKIINQIKVIFPYSNSSIVNPRDLDGKRKPLIFEAATSIENYKLYWYLNNEYIGVTEKNHSLSKRAKVGKNELYLIDEKGNEKLINFKIN